MTQDGPRYNQNDVFIQCEGTSSLAARAVSLVSRRQGLGAMGTRRFIIDHFLRTVTQKGPFDPEGTLEDLRSYRLSVDTIIDTYVPAAARMLGELWETNEVDFATVTIGTLRLQGVLSIAATESLDLGVCAESQKHMLIVVPMGEQHTLGAFVLAAQLRRLGVRTELSFCEANSEILSRVLTNTPDMVLFTAASRATLETVAKIVKNVKRVLAPRPAFGVGGHLSEADDVAKEISGVDLVTTQADAALSFVMSWSSRPPEDRV